MNSVVTATKIQRSRRMSDEDHFSALDEDIKDIVFRSEALAELLQLEGSAGGIMGDQTISDAGGWICLLCRQRTGEDEAQCDYCGRQWSR